MAVTQVTKLGRPTLYKSEYCQMLIDHMGTGLSYESFAGLVGVSLQTLHDWQEAHPEFLEAKGRAVQMCRLFWEKAGLQGIFMGGKDNPFNARIWEVNMRNRFRKEWTESKEVELKVVEDKSQAKEELEKLKQMIKEEESR